MSVNTDPWAAMQQELETLRAQVKALKGESSSFYRIPDPREARYGHYHMDPVVPTTKRVTMETPPETLTRDQLITYVGRLRKKIRFFQRNYKRNSPE